MATDLTSDLAKRLAQHDGCSRFGTVDLALLEAVRLTRERPNYALENAINEAKAALVGDSNDAEHDALYSLISVLGYNVPTCLDDDSDSSEVCGAALDGTHAKDCPCKAWEKEGQ